MENKRKILIIDDEEDFSFFVKRNLERINYEVLTAKEGNEGFELAKKNKPALVLLDIMMPGIDGFTVLKKIREDQNIKRIPVIMLTGKEDKESQRKAKELFNNDYLVKPVETAELRKRIGKILQPPQGS